MSVPFPLPREIAQCVGPLYAVEYPPQGMAFQVAILTSARGRFVLKVAHTQAMIRALSREAHILTTLQQYVPFVAQPLADAQVDGGRAFLFSYLEGESLHMVIQRASVQERHRLVARYGQALQRIHSWKPDLPYPADWLAEKLAWLSANIIAHPSGTLVTHTNSSFDGSNALNLLADLLNQKASIKNDIVFGHYDYCLPNALVQGQQVAGIIDWSGGGYIDRRFDLATALFSMRLFGFLQDTSYQSAFLEAYGYTEPPDTLYYFEALHALTCAFWQ
jgi:aminoglycoside phosphotransferase